MIAFASLFLGLVVGLQPVTVIVGASVAAVEFELDGEPAGRVEGKPWSLEIDLGKELEPHELIARAFDAKGQEIARARQWLNLPRPPAEVEILLERDRTGHATAARLTWGSVVAPRPTKVTLTFDRRPLSLNDSRRAVLPNYDPFTTHILSAEVEFPSDVRSRSDIVLGGGSSNDAKSELTAVPFRLRAEKSVPAVEKLRGRFSKKGEPMSAVAVEHGPADVLVVRDLGTQQALRWLGSGGPLRDPRLDKPDRIKIVWPVAQQIRLSQQSRAELFDNSRYLTTKEGGFYFLLTRIHYPEGYSPPRRFADAVAVAGLQAYAGHSRRAVVLVLGGSLRDDSRYAPDAVRRYLERIHVPLHVWSLESAEADSASAWGEREEVSSLSKLGRAVARLKEDLEAQHIVWLEGKHRPQDIVLSDQAEGIELVR